MTEIEKNQWVAGELFGDREFPEEVLWNRLIDWDKAFTCILYTRKSYALEKEGYDVYKDIRKRCEDFLEYFKKQLTSL